MLKLRNKTRGASKVGYLVKAVRGGFVYAGAGDTPVGVVTEVVSSGAICNIQTEGRTKVYVGETIQAGQALRLTTTDEGGISGQAYAVGDVTDYVSVGYSTTHGRGLIEVSVNIGASSGGSGGGGIADAPIDGNTYGRLNAAWSIVTSGIADAASDGIAYSRRNANWVNSNLIIDGSGGAGAATAIVNYDERLTIVGDGTYISSTYSTYVNGLSQTIHQIELSLAPGALDTRWDIMTADGTVATARPYTTAQIGNTANVAFLEGVYTSISYALNTTFTDYSPTLTEPANEVTIEVDHAQLRTDGYLYYQSDITTLLSGYATQSWVTTNFDNYNHWDVEVGGVGVDVINTGDAVNFAAGSNMTVTWGGPNTITFAMTTAFGTMSSWNWRILSTNHPINNGGVAELIANTGISIAYNLGGGGEHQAIITNSLPSLWTADTYGITYANHVGIGVASHSTYQLYVLGTSYLSGATAINGTLSVSSTTTLTGDVTMVGGAGALNLKAGATDDHVYVKWYADSAAQTTRSAYMGFSSAGNNSWFLKNEFTDGHIYLNPGGTSGSVILQYGGATRFSTTSAGLTGVGTLTMPAISSGASTNSTHQTVTITNSNTGTSAGAKIQFIVNGNNLVLASFGDGHLTYGSNHSRLYTTAGGGNIGIGSSTQLGFLFTVNGDVKLYYNNAVKIATTSTGVYITGNVIADGEVESWDTSDIRLKRNWREIPLDRSVKLLDAQAIEYDHINKDGRHIGLIAQEIREIFPEAVKEDGKGTLMIQYGKLVAPMLSLIQNQDRRILELERKLSKY